MLLPSDSPRQMMVTLLAWLEKNSAACPAEFPAPTMWTSRPWAFAASLGAAPYEMPFPTRRSNPGIDSCRLRREAQQLGHASKLRACDSLAVDHANRRAISVVRQ